MRWVVLLAALPVAGCMAGPNYTRPTLPLPASYHGLPTKPPPTEHWWKMFHDPVLDRLIEKALAANLTIEAALARVDQADAAARGSARALRPLLSTEFSAAQILQSQNAGLGQLSRYGPLLDELLGEPATSNLSRSVGDYQAGANASWDLDFAGGLRRQAQAAGAQSRAALAEAELARLTVSAELADAYVSFRGSHAELAALRRADDALRARTEIMRARVRLGAAPPSALDHSIAEAAQVSAALPLAHAIREFHANRIAVLVGQSPSVPLDELEEIAPIPKADRFGAGVPAQLLRRRPDLVAAEERLIAANAGVGAALAEYYPRITLSALLGVNSTGLGNLFTGNSVAASGGGLLRWRLFDFGRIDAEVAAARGRDREALAAYRAAILRASEEVESGFVRAEAEEVRTAQLALRRAHLAAAAATSDLALGIGAVSRDANIAANLELAIADADLAKAQADAGRAAIAARRALGN